MIFGWFLPFLLPFLSIYLFILFIFEYNIVVLQRSVSNMCMNAFSSSLLAYN